MSVIKMGYVARSVKSSRRNWWLVKNHIVNLGRVSIPQMYVGKRVRFKIEIIDEVVK